MRNSVVNEGTLGPASGGAGVGFADRQQIVLGMEGTPGTRLSSQRTWHSPECVRQCIKEKLGCFMELHWLSLEGCLDLDD